MATFSILPMELQIPIITGAITTSLTGQYVPLDSNELRSNLKSIRSLLCVDHHISNITKEAIAARYDVLYPHHKPTPMQREKTRWWPCFEFGYYAPLMKFIHEYNPGAHWDPDLYPDRDVSKLPRTYAPWPDRPPMYIVFSVIEQELLRLEQLKFSSTWVMRASKNSGLRPLVGPEDRSEPSLVDCTQRPRLLNGLWANFFTQEEFKIDSERCDGGHINGDAFVPPFYKHPSSRNPICTRGWRERRLRCQCAPDNCLCLKYARHHWRRVNRTSMKGWRNRQRPR